MNVRQLLPKMVGVSNDSRLTRDVADALATALTDKQLNDFLQWLQIVEQERQNAAWKRRPLF